MNENSNITPEITASSMMLSQNHTSNRDIYLVHPEFGSFLVGTFSTRFKLYEVAQLRVLVAAAFNHTLNNPIGYLYYSGKSSIYMNVAKLLTVSTYLPKDTQQAIRDKIISGNEAAWVTCVKENH